MYKEKSICVVVVAFCEERLLPKVINTMPSLVDHIVIVDDASSDRTFEVAQGLAACQPERILAIRHDRNRGVGAAISSGYKWARDHKIDIAVVMAGDAQMDPADLPALLDPVAEGRADYAKGNRLFTGDAWSKIPHVRYLGNAALSLLTKIASGYWHVADSQSGYTAINLRMLTLIDWDVTYSRYGCPNDYLTRLNVFNARVADVPVQPVYDQGQKSGIRLARDIPRLSWLLLRLFVWRIVQKYVIRDFHPLVFFYAAGFATGAVATALFVRLLVLWARHGAVPQMTALAFGFLAVVSVQFTMFAMWFDTQENKELKIDP
jgi:glycosyltransferase involved in cell wall biosynthesis